jgi:hypothetical protein
MDESNGVSIINLSFKNNLALFPYENKTTTKKYGLKQQAPVDDIYMCFYNPIKTNI